MTAAKEQNYQLSLSKKVDFGSAKSRSLGPKVDKKTLRLPNFKGRTCKLNFLHFMEAIYLKQFT